MKGILILATLASFAAVSFAATDKIVCYFGSWAIYRNGNGKFDVEDISSDLCTHIIFTFVGLNIDGTIKILDQWNEIDLRALERFNNLKSRNPSIKTLVAIGGWNEGSAKYSDVVNSPVLRKTLVDSIVNFVAKYGYDGFDLDWEYPAQRGGAPSDRTAFISLLQELRERFDQNGWLLSAAVAASKSYHTTSYDVPQMNKYLDFINIMAYDLHGSWDGKTGQNAPLFASKIDTTADDKLLNIDNVITGWIADGAKPEKLILGMGTYGRTFTLSSSSNNALGAPAINGGNAGPYTSEVGFLGYNEICEKLKAGGWTKVWDDEQKTPYLYNGNQWVGYDDIESIKYKSQYAVDKKLGGAMIWSIETDDHSNICGDGKFPLLTTINTVLKGTSGSGSGIVSASTSVAQETTTKASTTTTTQAATTTKTTTAPPTNNSGEAICHSEGSYVRDPNNCGVYYYCQKTNSGFKQISLKCPSGLVYDTTKNICNYPSTVVC